MSTVGPNFMTIREVADRLRLHRATVYRKIVSGDLPAVQTGHARSAIRVDEDELTRWLYDEGRLGKEGS